MRGHFAPGAMVPKVLEQKLSEQNDDSKKSHFILIPAHSDVPGSGAKVRTWAAGGGAPLPQFHLQGAKSRRISGEPDF
jgi:hypothetical protein